MSKIREVKAANIKSSGTKYYLSVCLAFISKRALYYFQQELIRIDET